MACPLGFTFGWGDAARYGSAVAMPASDLQRSWRLPALAALLAVSGCKDLMPTYMGGDVGMASLHVSQRPGAHERSLAADTAVGSPGVSSTHAIVAANASKQGAQTRS
jgi:hypothetical protein